MQANSKHMEWAASFFAETGFGDILENCDVSRHKEALAQHLAAFEAEVREDMAETHVDKADAWNATIRAGKRLTDAHGWNFDMDAAPKAFESVLIYQPDTDRNSDAGEAYYSPSEYDGDDQWRWVGTNEIANPVAWKLITLPAQPEKEGE